LISLGRRLGDSFWNCLEDPLEPFRLDASKNAAPKKEIPDGPDGLGRFDIVDYLLQDFITRGQSASTNVAMAMVTVHPGGLRELHWHPNADEWQYYISGKGRMTVVATGNRARTMDFQAGDVGYVEKTLLHYIENTGDTDLVFLEMFKSSFYQDLSLSEWLTHTPPELVMAHLNIDKATLDTIPRDELVIVPR
jgi:oxalate decarboxylase family bicupin protein